MKVLLINGSPRSNGNTFTALKEVAGALGAEGVETEIVSIGAKAVQGCIACRRGGASAALDRLNKYFSINNMPVVSSQYWNIAYGSQPGEAARDAEGMQTMRTLGRNMAWVLKGLKTQPLPGKEPAVKTNFVR